MWYGARRPWWSTALAQSPIPISWRSTMRPCVSIRIGPISIRHRGISSISRPRNPRRHGTAGRLAKTVSVWRRIGSIIRQTLCKANTRRANEDDCQKERLHNLRSSCSADGVYRSPRSPSPLLTLVLACLRRSTLSERPTSSCDFVNLPPFRRT